MDPDIGSFTMDRYIGFITTDPYIRFSTMDPYIMGRQQKEVTRKRPGSGGIGQL